MDLFFILSLNGKEKKMHESFIKKVDEHGGSYMFEVCTIVFLFKSLQKRAYSWLVEWKQDSFLSTLPRGEKTKVLFISASRSSFPAFGSHKLES